VYKPIFVSSDYNAGDGTDSYGDLEKDVSDYADEPAIFKASDLSVEKEAAEVDDDGEGDTDAKGVGVGDTLEFTVTTPIVGYTKNFTSPQFKITDELSEGLELVEGSVTVEGTGIGSDDYTIDEDTDGFVVSFEEDFLWSVVGAPTCTITYQATVVSDAGAQVNQMDNNVTLNFSNAPDDEDGAGELTDKTRHYTFDIDGDVLGGSEETGGDPTQHRTEEVQKVVVETTDTTEDAVKATEYNGTNALEGAEFQLTDQATGRSSSGPIR